MGVERAKMSVDTDVEQSQEEVVSQKSSKTPASLKNKILPPHSQPRRQLAGMKAYSRPALKFSKNAVGSKSRAALATSSPASDSENTDAQ